jgi:hypothetical protein
VPYLTLGDLVILLNMFGCLTVLLQSIIISRHADTWGPEEQRKLIVVLFLITAILTGISFLTVIVLYLLYRLCWVKSYKQKPDETSKRADDEDVSDWICLNQTNCEASLKG